ncbi:hypothetical protein CNQ87_08180 [Lysinibacillus fusiformis]|uniref:hypothetical protein n=1 Tax=Lysinibacillus fusiformis TaxID=28031 RepID=UPI000BBB2FAB|nr:hypothetical protein [Lysinibacillus fusiformis]PCD84347.1 hypothetical protein CNQ87_08180 [Lysinibacillus fusiformis]
MYANRGGTFYGMSVKGVRSGLENEAIARGYSASSSSFNNFFSYKTEIDNNRPLAVKFDKYFTLFEPNAIMHMIITGHLDLDISTLPQVQC